MCIKLLQVYACNHSKIVCKTPCMHALDTGRKVRQDSALNSELSRSNSAVSSLAPSNSRLPSPPTSPLGNGSSTAHRLIPQGRPSPLGYAPGYPDHSPTSPTYRSPTSPTLHVAPSIVNLPDEQFTIEPNYCPYHFPRYLPQSNRPCIECYIAPEWEDLSMRWAKQYRQDHPKDKLEDVERLSGNEGLRERQRRKMREGLLNVFVDGDENAGHIFRGPLLRGNEVNEGKDKRNLDL